MVAILACYSSDMSQEIVAQDFLDELGVCSEIVHITAPLTSANTLADLEQVHGKGMQVLIIRAGVNTVLSRMILDHTHFAADQLVT